MKLQELANKKILILGFGVEGQTTLEFLRRHFPTAEIGVADQKDDPRYLEKQKDFDLAIRTPGLPKRFITIPYTTATNIFFANVNGTTIGVTGSKGKSTTASLIHAILQEAGFRSALVGNIGTPMLRKLVEVQPPPVSSDGAARTEIDSFVCELSSYQLDDIEYSPHISVFLNFFPDHMDYHGGVGEYWEAKKRIVAKTAADDYFVYNPAYPELAELAKNIRAQTVPFIATLPFPDSIISLLGAHNKDNVRAAVTVAQILHIPAEAIQTAVKNFTPLPHRLELVGTFRGITFYDDAISTTPESTIKAIQALPNIGTLLLGGQNRGYDFTALAEVIIAHGIPNVALFPESGKVIGQALKQRGGALKVLATSSMEAAVKFAYENSPVGSICLLSTASPSYSLWKNFEEKGDLFQYWAKIGGKKGY